MRADLFVKSGPVDQYLDHPVDALPDHRPACPVVEDGTSAGEIKLELLVCDEGLQIGVKALVQDEPPGFVSLRIRTMEETLMFRLV